MKRSKVPSMPTKKVRAMVTKSAKEFRVKAAPAWVKIQSYRGPK